MPRASRATPPRRRATRAVAMRPKLKVWVVFPGGVKFGDGRADLLVRIERAGSLRGAVAEIGMSYRSAWGYLRELERAAGFPLLERRAGRGPDAGTRLTTRGREFLARYRRFRRGLDAAVQRRFARTMARR